MNSAEDSRRCAGEAPSRRSNASRLAIPAWVRALWWKEMRAGRGMYLAFIGLALLGEPLLRCVINFIWSDLWSDFDSIGLARSAKQTGAIFLYMWALPLVFSICTASELVAREKDTGSFSALTSLPISTRALGLAKMLYGLIATGVFTAIMTCVFVVFSDMNPLAPIIEFLARRTEPTAPAHLIMAALLYIGIIVVIYATAFLSSCLASGPIPAMILGAMMSMMILVVIGIGAFSASWLNAIFIAGDYNREEDLIPIMLMTCGIIVTGFVALHAYLYFRFYQKNLKQRIIGMLTPTIVTLAAVSMLIALWSAMLAIVNHPRFASEQIVIDATPLGVETDGISYAEFVAATRRWRNESQFEEDRLIRRAWETMPTPFPDTVVVPVRGTRDTRAEMIAFLTQRNLAPYLKPADFEYPALFVVLDLFRREGIEAIDLARHDDRPDAIEKIEKMLSAADRLGSPGPIIQSVVGMGMASLAAYAACEVFRLDRPPDSRVEAARLAAALDQCDSNLATGLDRSFRQIAAQMDWAINHMDENLDQSGWRVSWLERRVLQYPYVNLELLQRRIRDDLEALLKINDGDLYLRRDALHAYQAQSRAHASLKAAVFHPGNVLLLTFADDEWSNGIPAKAAAQCNLRLAKLQIYLALFKGETGRLPQSLDELQRHFSIAAIVNPLNGEAFPYPEIIVADRVDSSYADRMRADLYGKDRGW